ncbi:hypothetical protein MAP00_002343 [Monascus purpureus]|nr:hypothetical protein MAP00_002343 [Monascus purpureus]
MLPVSVDRPAKASSEIILTLALFFAAGVVCRLFPASPPAAGEFASLEMPMTQPAHFGASLGAGAPLCLRLLENLDEAQSINKYHFPSFPPASLLPLSLPPLSSESSELVF